LLYPERNKPPWKTLVVGIIDNLAADDLVLTAQDLEDLDAVSVLPVEYPSWIQGDMANRLPQTA
jgi:hypothetical protein